jgi:hypothetical protein
MNNLLPSPSVPFGLRCVAPPWNEDDPRRRELESRLASDHLARSIEEAVPRLDLTAFCRRYGRTGSLPHPPQLLLRAVLYEARLGRHSPAQWHRDASESEPVRWLLRGCRPARSCWYTFRDRIAPFLDDWNRQVLTTAVAEGWTPAQRAALDGTPVAAHASRHKMVNAETLQRRLEQLSAALAADALGPPPLVPGWMAKTPRGRQHQHQRLTRAQAQMEARQARNHAKRKSKRADPHKIVVSLSDPEAIPGRDKDDVYRPLYNVQLVDDLDSPFVLGYEVFAQQNDAGLLRPMAERTRALVGHLVPTMLADTAYTGGADLAAAEAVGVTLYAPLAESDPAKAKQFPKAMFRWDEAQQNYECPRGNRLEYERSSPHQRSGTEWIVLHVYRCEANQCRACPLQARCTPKPDKGRTISRSEHEAWIEALRQRMQTTEAKDLYRLRRQTVELVNADWKEHRRLRRFNARGRSRVRGQVGVIVLAHNLLTLLNEEAKARAPLDAKPHQAVA